MSADLYRHPVGWVPGSALAAHDPAAVQVTVYAAGHVEDDPTARLRRAISDWVPVANLDDAALAQRVASDETDVLVDLSGHAAGHRLGAFARRPAPVQATRLGYPGTTGLPSMDAALLDDDHLSPGDEAIFSERVLRLPRLRLAYEPPADAPDVAPPPSRAGHPPTFGFFNNLSKIGPSTVALWARALDAVPQLRLLLWWQHLADPEIGAAVARRFMAFGVNPTRLILEGAEPHRALLQRQAAADVALDPLDFGGGRTTAEALWMGVSVVTCPGPRVAARQSHAMLRAAERPESSAARPRPMSHWRQSWSATRRASRRCAADSAMPCAARRCSTAQGRRALS